MDLKNFKVPNDEPSQFDSLGRQELLLGVATTVDKVDPPMVIGIHGDWGSGKTSFLIALQNLLSKEKRKSLLSSSENSLALRFEQHFGKDYDLPVIWFNPWKFQFEQDPIIPLLESIKQQVPESVWIKSLKAIRKAVEDPKLRLIGKAAIGVGTFFGPGWIQTLSVKTGIFSGKKNDDTNEVFEGFRRIHEQFDQSLELMLKAYPNNGIPPQKMVIFIDDLDRCEANYVVKILEALKLHLLNKHCVFIMGAATDRIKQSLIDQGLVRDIPSAKDYLEKIIQLPIQLPPIWDRTLNDFIKSLGGALFNDGGYDQHCYELLKSFSNRNPRKLKQFFSWFTLQMSMVSLIEGLNDPAYAGSLIENQSLLLKIKLLQFSKPKIYVTPSDFNDIDNKPSNDNTEDSQTVVDDRLPFEKLPPYTGEWLKQENKNHSKLLLFLALTIDEGIAEANISELKKEIERGNLLAFEGIWSGYFKDESKKINFTLQLELDEEGRIYGFTSEEGHLGDAKIYGEINTTEKSIEFAKRYENKEYDDYEVIYRGKWNRNLHIKGKWQIVGSGSDKFEMSKI